jgi:hypothetical protein
MKTTLSCTPQARTKHEQLFKNIQKGTQKTTKFNQLCQRVAPSCARGGARDVTVVPETYRDLIGLEAALLAPV